MEIGRIECVLDLPPQEALADVVLRYRECDAAFIQSLAIGKFA